MLRTLVALSLLAPAVATAQTSPLVGSWKVSYVVGGKSENGVVTPINGSGVLVIAPQGDSLVGTLTTDPVPEMPPRPALNMKSANTDPAIFVWHGVATVVRNEEKTMIDATAFWTLSSSGDALNGTVVRKAQGLPDQPASPVTGTRLKV